MKILFEESARKVSGLEFGEVKVNGMLVTVCSDVKRNSGVGLRDSSPKN